MTPQLRTRQNLVRNIADLLGGGDEQTGRERAAVLAGVSVEVMHKACNDRDLTVGAMTTLIVNAGKRQGNSEFDDIVNELVRHFVPPRRKLIFQDLVDQFESSIGQAKLFLEAMKNGGRLTPVLVTEVCGQCDGPVEYIKICPACSRAKR